MAARQPNRLQNEFLLHLIQAKTPATLFLLGGTRLVGTIAAFDDFCISLVSDGHLQAVYKQEICVISTSAPVNLWDDPEAPRPNPAPRSAPPRRGAEQKKLVVERVRRITPSRRPGIRKN